MGKIECIIGGVELSRDEVETYYTAKKYIVAYGGIWQISFSQAQNKFCGQKVSRERGLSSRGRFYALSASEVNKLLGVKLLSEENY